MTVHSSQCARPQCRRRRGAATGIAVALGALGLATVVINSAAAATVDTFGFSQVGWTTYLANDPTTTPDPGGRLEGTFIGTVEPSGLIQLNDLNSFTALYVDFAAPGGFVNMGTR